jgi:hypothetical protein
VTGEWKDIFDIVTHDIPEIEPSEGVTFRTTETSVGAALIGRVVGDTVGWLGRNRVPIIARVVDIDQEAQKQSYAN